MLLQETKEMANSTNKIFNKIINFNCQALKSRVTDGHSDNLLYCIMHVKYFFIKLVRPSAI